MSINVSNFAKKRTQLHVRYSLSITEQIVSRDRTLLDLY